MSVYTRDIYHKERVFLDSEKTDGKYYIGIAALKLSCGNIIFANAISTRSFFSYEYPDIMGYLTDYSILILRKPGLHIMQLQMSGEQMNVVIKTHWIRIIQRTFRKIYKQQGEVLAIRRQPRSILHFSVFGKYLNGSNHFPTIRGMLAGIKKTVNTIIHR
jgi:hypothetical protein